MAKAKNPRNGSKKNGDASPFQAAPESSLPVPETKLSAAIEAKKNVVAINLEEEIRRRAYEIFEERGRMSGNEREDWFRAEREVLARYLQTA